MRRRWSKDHERQSRRLVDRDWIVWRGEDAMESAFGSSIIAQHLRDRVGDFVIGQRLGAIIRQAVQRRLGREPVAARLFVEVGGALAQFAQSVAENRQLVAGFGAGQAQPLSRRGRRLAVRRAAQNQRNTARAARVAARICEMRRDGFASMRLGSEPSPSISLSTTAAKAGSSG